MKFVRKIKSIIPGSSHADFENNFDPDYKKKNLLDMVPNVHQNDGVS